MNQINIIKKIKKIIFIVLFKQLRLPNSEKQSCTIVNVTTLKTTTDDIVNVLYCQDCLVYSSSATNINSDNIVNTITVGEINDIIFRKQSKDIATLNFSFITFHPKNMFKLIPLKT